MIIIIVDFCYDSGFILISAKAADRQAWPNLDL